MTGGTRIVAIDASLSHDEQDVSHSEPASDAPLALEDYWVEASGPEIPINLSRSELFLGLAAALLTAGWTALFALGNLPQLQAGGTVMQWTAWIRDWSAPILLIAVLWLVTMRNSRREAARFGETARLLGDESSRLERRLTTVNRELSLAREFLAAQSRDLDAMGRMATERLSLHSETLASLIQDNSARLDTIGAVSTAAMDNMEKLRGQLPVIASSAKDVTNNIANAGRTAHAQIEDMIQGFNRLNQFGRASEQQIAALRKMVDETLGEFNQRSEHLGTITSERFAALTATGEEFRAQLDQQELDALGTIRTRAKAMSVELAEAQTLLDSHEAESLSSLRARLTAVRDESAAVTRSLRDGESTAIDAWRKSVAKLEDDLRLAVERIAEIDEHAMSSANARLEALTGEAQEIDNRMIERDRVFALEIDQRRADFEARQADYSQRLTDQIAGLDEAIAQRRAAHEDHARILAAHTNSLAAQLADFGEQMQTIAAHGGEAEAAVAASLTTLAAKLDSSREALVGTDREIAALTDGSVRLLELIQASVQHSQTDLPEAIAIGESRLTTLEDRANSVRAVVDAAHFQGAALANDISNSNEGLITARAQIEALGGDLDSIAAVQNSALAGLQQSLAGVRQESTALADHAQGELTGAIALLNTAASSAVAGIEKMSAAAIMALADRLGDESGQAIDKAMRNRVAEVAGQLEQAAAHAAGVSREAALQLRDQLAKVSELAGHLERRVAHARTRAEEQVDNDFARRAALITESLNSNAIDIARAIDTDVGDTAWAAYLKGDRGIFTRRAVKLLETPDAKAVAQLYESEGGFRDNVSRYIHDFEAMLRQLLSTRDGHALGVTLLSSDMGKLYVALAQSIERLRN